MHHAHQPSVADHPHIQVRRLAPTQRKSRVAEHVPLCTGIHRGRGPHEGTQFQVTHRRDSITVRQMSPNETDVYLCGHVIHTDVHDCIPGTIKETNPEVNKAHNTLPPKHDFLIPTASTPPGSWVTHTSVNSH